MGVLQLIWLCEIIGGMLLMYKYKIPQCGYMEQGLIDIAFYVQNIKQLE